MMRGNRASLLPRFFFDLAIKVGRVPILFPQASNRVPIRVFNLAITTILGRRLDTEDC